MNQIKNRKRDRIHFVLHVVVSMSTGCGQFMVKQKREMWGQTSNAQAQLSRLIDQFLPTCISLFCSLEMKVFLLFTLFETALETDVSFDTDLLYIFFKLFYF